MPSFQNPAAFLLLILIPVLFLLRKLGFFSKISFVITLSDWGGESFSWKGKIRRFASFLVFLLTILGYVSAVTALAGPIMYKQERVYTSRGTDILFVFDILLVFQKITRLNPQLPYFGMLHLSYILALH